MPKYFGTDGFRGRSGEILNADHAYKIGRFLGWYYRKSDGKPRVVIGKDTRLSSYSFEYAVAAGLTASGADAYMLHVIPTPGVSFAVRQGDFDCGVMISASHNPFYDNGIKLVDAGGEKMDDATLCEVEKYLDGEIPELPFATDEHIGRIVDYSAGRNRYTGYLISLVITFFVPPLYTGIAFDSGGVASGPMTTTFILPFAIGACEMAGGNVMTDAFGIVAMVAMTPLITIQVMGLYSRIQHRQLLRRARYELLQIEDNMIEYELEEDAA